MPILRNPRHERFAQELAKGKSQLDAYVAAGYRANRGHASTLKQERSISERVAEILANRERQDAKAAERAADRLSISKEEVIQMLLSDRDLAYRTGHPGAATNAAKLIGMELHGMFINRTQTKIVDEFSNMTEAQLRAWLRENGVQGIGEDDGPATTGH